jgi:hypothetical protein
MRYVTGDKVLNPGIPVAGEIAADASAGAADGDHGWVAYRLVAAFRAVPTSDRHHGTWLVITVGLRTEWSPLAVRFPPVIATVLDSAVLGRRLSPILDILAVRRVPDGQASANGALRRATRRGADEPEPG